MYIHVCKQVKMGSTTLITLQPSILIVSLKFVPAAGVDKFPV